MSNLFAPAAVEPVLRSTGAIVPSAIFAVVTAPSARSAVTIVPSRIVLEETAPVAIFGSIT